MKSSAGAKGPKVRKQAESGEDRFFQALIERRIADAEKELDLMRASIAATERAKGYLKAYEGLILTVKAGSDRYLYFSKMEKTQKHLRAIRREFVAQAADQLHTDYDRGYFEVLENYVRKLERSGNLSENIQSEKKKS